MDDPPFIWCCVANITSEPDRNGLPGTKHFSPGTKLYCFPQAWGDGLERTRVLGRHRHSDHLVDMVVQSSRIVTPRPTKVYKPVVIEAMDHYWDNSDESRDKATALVAALERRRLLRIGD
jgi:hypothetical protein